MAIPNTARTKMVSGVAGNIAFDGPTRVQTGVLDTGTASNNVWGRAFTVKNSGDETVQAGGTGAFAGIMISPKTYAIDTDYAAYNTVAEFLTMGEVFVDLDAAAAPVEGDQASDRLIVTDPRSGVAFEFSVWPGYRKVRLEVALAWGVKATKREHIALLLG